MYLENKAAIIPSTKILQKNFNWTSGSEEDEGEEVLN